MRLLCGEPAEGATMDNLTEKTEQELRETKVEFPKTLDELNEIIKQLTERNHDYGTCVYAMSIAAVATFNYIGSKLGCTGFQASCADLDILRRTRHYEDGFMITDYNKLLYPQYWDDEHFPTKEQLLEKNKEQLAKKAKQLLEDSNGSTHPNIIEHWKMIAGLST